MKKLALATVLMLAAAPAMAHPGHGFGLAAGMIHPLTGADHLLAMLAVGLWSGFAMPRRLWAGAASFMAAMTAGAGLGLAGVALPMAETLIALSVVVFGAMTLSAQAGRGAGAGLAVIAGLALVHGYAHGIEATGPVAAFLAGMLVSTAALHLAGIALARAIATGRAARLVQGVLGASIAVSGLWMMAG